MKLTLGMIWTLIQKYQLRMKGKAAEFSPWKRNHLFACRV